MTSWTTRDIPSQAGKLAIVTGTGGLGFETALELARAGADVIVAGRNADKGRDAVARIEAAHPGTRVRFGQLDLASLADVTAFARRIAAEHDRIDVLVDNAGVMAPPQRRTTQDGFELQLGTNHLGHFALTGHLLPQLRRADGARVVSLSSLMHRAGAIQFDDLQFERRYQQWPSYGQSKLATLMFALELQRRSDAHGWGIVSIAAHPGYSRTDLIANGPGTGGVMMRMNSFVQPMFSHSAAAGALPTLFAATAPEATGGAYYGPKGLLEMTGDPGPAKMSRRAKNVEDAARLWDVSEQLTGVRFGP